MKTVVVGNGILGLACALRLAQRGGVVVIVGDPARRGSATIAAAAMLSAFGEVDATSLASNIGRTKLAIARSASDMWPGFAAELGVAMAAGTYIFDGASAFAAIVGALVEYREPHAIVDPAEVPGYAPAQRATRAVRLDREGWIDARAVVTALERALAAAGVEQIAGVANRVLGAGGVELADGRRIEGTHCLIANGASLSALLAASALPLTVQPVLYGVGTTLELRAPVSHSVCMRDTGVYLVPYGDRVVVGSTNRVAAVPATDHMARTRVLAAVSAQLDTRLADAKIIREYIGWRPTTEDGYPLIGATSIPNLAIASGTRRDGFHLAPLIANHIAAVMHGEPGDPRFSSFAPERAVIP